MMGTTSPSRQIATLICVVLPTLATLALAEQPTAAADPAHATASLDGLWLVDAAQFGQSNQLGFLWRSTVSIDHGGFSISRFWGVSRNWTGRLRVDPRSTPAAIDLQTNALDLKEIGKPVEYPAAKVQGIYKLTDDRMTICFQLGSPRPNDFRVTDKQTVLLTLVRADRNFRGFPEKVTVTVRMPDGRPAAGATLFRFMSLWHGGDKPIPNPHWKYIDVATTDATGKAHVAYDSLTPVLAARDPSGKLVGMTPLSPASLDGGSATVQLHPECLLRGEIRSAGLAARGEPLGWTNAYLLDHGQRMAACNSATGTFEFRVPPGKYTLSLYGSDVRGRTATVVVPPNVASFEMPPIDLPAAILKLLQGRPAPELAGVVGWRGPAMCLHELRGHVVLLNFWGYWCGPCVHEMPMLFDLHEKFKDKGLVIIGVHCDLGGEVDTAAKLDQKDAGYVNDLWHGRQIPYSVALVPGEEGSPANGRLHDAAGQYGIDEYPTTVIIDKEGNVAGTLDDRDLKSASDVIAKLLEK